MREGNDVSSVVSLEPGCVVPQIWRPRHDHVAADRIKTSPQAQPAWSRRRRRLGDDALGRPLRQRLEGQVSWRKFCEVLEEECDPPRFRPC